MCVASAALQRCQLHCVIKQENGASQSSRSRSSDSLHHITRALPWTLHGHREIRLGFRGSKSRDRHGHAKSMGNNASRSLQEAVMNHWKCSIQLPIILKKEGYISCAERASFWKCNSFHCVSTIKNPATVFIFHGCGPKSKPSISLKYIFRK